MTVHIAAIKRMGMGYDDGLLCATIIDEPLKFMAFGFKKAALFHTILHLPERL
jgi:hypothetical protein